MNKLVSLLIILGLILGLLYFSFYSLGQLFQFDPSLFLKAILYALGIVLLAGGFWLMLPKKLRIPLEAASRALTELDLRFFGLAPGNWILVPILSNAPTSLIAKIFGFILFLLGVAVIIYTHYSGFSLAR